MKMLILPILLLLWSGEAMAAITYAVDPESVSFDHDESLGTFQFNGITYGRIIAVSYTIRADDGNGRSAMYSGVISIPSGLNGFPTPAQLTTRIRNDAISSDAKAILRDQFRDMTRNEVKKRTRALDSVAVDGGGISLP